MARLGGYIEQIRGVSYKPTDLRDFLDENSVPLLRANNIQNGNLNLDDVIYVSKNKVTEKQYLKKGDVLICTSSGSKELVGKAAYVKQNMSITFGAFCKVVRPKTECKKYIGHFFQSPYYRRNISNLSAGANINNIRNEHIEDLEIPLPPLEEQRRIASVLDKVSDLIANRRAQLDKLDLLVKSRFVEMFGDPVSNEKNWPMVTLGDIAEIRIGPFGSLLHQEDYITGGHALVNPSHIIEGQICIDEKLTVSDKKYDELSAYQLKIDDIVLGRRGEMGRCAVVHQEGLLCGTGSMIIRPNTQMRPYFLQNIISNPAYKKNIEDKAVGVTMMNLNVPIVSALTVPLLPVHMQEQFIDFMGRVSKSKLTIQQSLDKLETLKKALMQQYFG